MDRDPIVLIKKKNYYTLPEFAERIGVSPASLRRWAKSGKFVPAEKTPAGRCLYSAEQVAEYFSKKIKYTRTDG